MVANPPLPFCQNYLGISFDLLHPVSLSVFCLDVMCFYNPFCYMFKLKDEISLNCLRSLNLVQSYSIFIAGEKNQDTCNSA